MIANNPILAVVLTIGLEASLENMSHRLGVQRSTMHIRSSLLSVRNEGGRDACPVQTNISSCDFSTVASLLSNHPSQSGS
jgi:hypothetical protein